VERPRTRYAHSGDLNIAYCRSDHGPIDVVVTPGFASHLELMWEPPFSGILFDRVARFSRVTQIDKRGVGLSDRISEPATLEQRMDDLRAVMDAEGIERAALIGISEGSSLSALFAATYPDRVSSLVLWAGGAGPPATDELRSWMLPGVEDAWGSGQIMSLLVRLEDPTDIERLAKLERYSMSPKMARALLSMNLDNDLRDILPAISAPTLVIHRTGDLVTQRDRAITLAELIPGALRVELPGDWHLSLVPGAEAEALDIIEEFVTGTPPAPDVDVDRVLTTVLFTDIVGSTRQLSELGDHGWRAQLDRHDAMVRVQLERFRGREIDTAGDGFFARFDGPARAVHCAHAIIEGARTLGIDVRAGVHVGECEIRGDGLAGIAVHVGARVSALAGAGEVLTTTTVRDLVAGSGIEFVDRGQHSLKGVPGEWAILSAKP